VIGRLPQTQTALTEAATAETEPKTRRRVYLGGWMSVPVFDFLALAADQFVPGPAIIESDTTTVLLRPRDTARFDTRGWLEVTIDAPPARA
jgi:N-methylhydantoinase A